MKRIVVLTLLLGCVQTKAYVVGFSRLYNPETKKSVDIVYDFHVEERNLTADDFEYKAVEYLKKHLYSSERRFLEAVEGLNDSEEAYTVAVIGESYGTSGYKAMFIAHLNSLIADRLTSITYVDGDTARFRFLRGYRGVVKGVLSISAPEILGLILNAGKSTWRNYYELYDKTINVFTKKVPYLDDQYWRWEYRGDNHFHALADVEMLKHILSLPQSHVIVYCGGWHGANIARFLREKAGFENIYEHGVTTFTEGQGRRDEIEPDHLWPLTYSSQMADYQAFNGPKPGLLKKVSGFFGGIMANVPYLKRNRP